MFKFEKLSICTIKSRQKTKNESNIKNKKRYGKNTAENMG